MHPSLGPSAMQGWALPPRVRDVTCASSRSDGSYGSDECTTLYLEADVYVSRYYPSTVDSRAVNGVPTDVRAQHRLTHLVLKWNVITMSKWILRTSRGRFEDTSNA